MLTYIVIASGSFLFGFFVAAFFCASGRADELEERRGDRRR